MLKLIAWEALTCAVGLAPVVEEQDISALKKTMLSFGMWLSMRSNAENSLIPNKSSRHCICPSCR